MGIMIKTDKVVMCEITWNEIADMKLDIPFEVQIRLLLNKKGFKFEGDGHPSLILNKSPRPLGEVICWRDYETGSIHYKQILNT